MTELPDDPTLYSEGPRVDADVIRIANDSNADGGYPSWRRPVSSARPKAVIAGQLGPDQILSTAQAGERKKW
jgi:hypothetical protein